MLEQFDYVFEAPSFETKEYQHRRRLYATIAMEQYKLNRKMLLGHKDQPVARAILRRMESKLWQLGCVVTLIVETQDNRGATRAQARHNGNVYTINHHIGGMAYLPRIGDIVAFDTMSQYNRRLTPSVIATEMTLIERSTQE